MENSTSPAFPIKDETSGLSIREYTAIHILAGLCANPELTDKDHKDLVTNSLILTNKLLNEL